jgi:hypothetical protein
MDRDIIIVSGLPRCGTSLLMQMLHAGGIEVVTDQIREPDADNPRGYFEYERVKTNKHDATWIPETRGKAFKMVSQLLYHLPQTENYRIIFMDRDLDESIRSQEKMLARLGKPAAPREIIRESFVRHLERLRDWLASQHNASVLRVEYRNIVDHPHSAATRIADFLQRPLDIKKMTDAVDPTLYRNRSADISPPESPAT